MRVQGESAMRSDSFTRTCLVVILLLLLVLSLRAYFAGDSAHAAAAIQYKIVVLRGDSIRDLENQLNEQGKDGWTLAATPVGYGHGFCIFKK